MVFCGKRWLLLSLTGLLSACMGDSQTTLDDQGARASAFAWQVPAVIALPVEPQNNPMTEAKFQLGRHLFYDERLSANRDIACATCHHQDKAFTDGRQFPLGTFGHTHPRNTQPIGNTAWFATFNWASPDVTTLEQQIRGPLFNTEPIPEHGLNDTNVPAILAELRADERYPLLFADAFPELGESSEWTFDDHIIPALASFVRGITSFDSPFDRYLSGDQAALSASARRGLSLFADERLECTHCHFDDRFLTNNRMDRGQRFASPNFHNTGSVLVFSQPNRGVYEVSGDTRNFGQFKTPSLRNIALTAPYSHDGSHATLEDIIDTYSRSGKGGNYAVDGDLSTGFTLTTQEKTDLLAFLCSLTDASLITNPRYSNPWPDEQGNPVPVVANPLADPANNPQCRLR